jgi:uncharacterized protein YggU (UPF0235/DUF167 family)
MKPRRNAAAPPSGQPQPAPAAPTVSVSSAITPHAEGAILAIRAQPGARRNELRLAREGQLKACVTAAPEKGKANRAIAELLGRSLDLKKSQIELLSGETAQQKRWLIRGLTVAELAARVAAASAGNG